MCLDDQDGRYKIASLLSISKIFNFSLCFRHYIRPAVRLIVFTLPSVLPTMADSQPLPSPGVGARRKGPKSIPKLDFSAFSPMSASSDKFPLPPSPSALHPQQVTDAHVVVDAPSLDKWTTETDSSFGKKVDGVVISLKGEPADVQKIVDG